MANRCGALILAKTARQPLLCTLPSTIQRVLSLALRSSQTSAAKNYSIIMQQFDAKIIIEVHKRRLKGCVHLASRTSSIA